MVGKKRRAYSNTTKAKEARYVLSDLGILESGGICTARGRVDGGTERASTVGVDLRGFVSYTVGHTYVATLTE
jgi:hypothetical protein